LTDVYANWRDALAGKKVDLHEGQPSPGYYKRRGPNKEWLPVAIWFKGEDLICRVGAEMKDPYAEWTWCAKTPVDKESAKHAFEHGAWPGDVPMNGHNSGQLSLDEEIKDAAEQAISWLTKTGKITDKTGADTAANWRSRLLDLKKQAEGAHKTEKEPHLRAGRAVDAKFKPLIDTCDTTCTKIRSLLTPYMVAEEQRLRAEQEAKIKEAVRNEEPIPVAPVKVSAGGQRGRKTGLKSVMKLFVTDHAKALAAFADHEEVKALVARLADRALRAGKPVDGAELREVKEAV
jgi:hypothetical protein